MRAHTSTSSSTFSQSSVRARTASAMASTPLASIGSRAALPPRRIGAMKNRSSSISSASRNAPASFGPPSSRTDVTPCSPSRSSAQSTRAPGFAPVATMTSAPAAASAWESARGAARDTTTVSGGSGAAWTSFDVSGRRAGASKTTRRGWGGQPPDPPARLAAHALDPRRELRVVAERRADADGDGVALGPPVVREAAGARAGDPLRVAGRGGHLPVERHGGLEEDPRPPRASVLAEGLVQRAGAGGEVPVGDLDLDPLVPQDPDPATGGLRARVVGGDDHAPDPGGDDRVRARWGPARVGAGLERHVHRR